MRDAKPVGSWPSVTEGSVMIAAKLGRVTSSTSNFRCESRLHVKPTSVSP